MARARKKTKPAPDTASVENPNWSRAYDGDRTNPRFVTVPFNHRESAISLLAAKGAIDPAQMAAADRFRAIWEALGGAGAGALDYSREPVDGGGASEPITERQLTAGKELKRAAEALRTSHGEYAYRLVTYVAGEGRSIHELTETRRQRDTMTDNLRAYLDVLSDIWGFANKGSLRKRNDLPRAREHVRPR